MPIELSSQTHDEDGKIYDRSTNITSRYGGLIVVKHRWIIWVIFTIFCIKNQWWIETPVSSDKQAFQSIDI